MAVNEIIINAQNVVSKCFSVTCVIAIEEIIFKEHGNSWSFTHSEKLME